MKKSKTSKAMGDGIRGYGSGRKSLFSLILFKTLSRETLNPKTQSFNLKFDIYIYIYTRISLQLSPRRGPDPKPYRGLIGNAAIQSLCS